MRSILVVALLIIGCAGHALSAESKFEKKFAVNPGGTLSITSDYGDIEIVGGSGSEVSVLARLTGSQKDLDDFEITATQTDGGVEVWGKSTRSRFFSWFGRNLEIQFSIRVPREYSARISTSGGDIRVVTLKGAVEGETSGGDLDLKEIEGSVRLQTSGGNIRAEKLTGDVTVETSGGNIALAGLTGNVNAETSGGNIRVGEVDGKVRVETSGGDVVIRMKRVNESVFAETSGGDIEISVPGDLAASIDASTSGGEVRCDLPVTLSGKISEHRIRGTINGGGKTIHAYTSGGDVSIRAAE
jgi:hypothetical protein